MNGFGSWFKGLKGKLFLLVAIPAFAITFLVLFVNMALNNAAESVKNGTVRGPLLYHGGEMVSSVNAIGRYLWSAQQTPLDSPDRPRLVGWIRGEVEHFEESKKAYELIHQTADAAELYKKAVETWPQFRQVVLATTSEIERNNLESNAAAHEMITHKVIPMIRPITDGFDNLSKFRFGNMQKVVGEQLEKSELLRREALGMGFVFIAMIVVIGLWLASRLSSQLSRIASSVSEAGIQVTAASGQLSSAAQQVSTGTTEAASSLEETVASVEELSSMVQLNASNAKEAAALSSTSSKAAEEGEAEIRRLIASMSEISQSSKKIEEIINVIDDIAFQTNLLALNAAVEAARAGEQGKGFAVVAEAVRNLAQRSASAAKDISNLIKDSVGKTERGSQIADTSGNVLKNIVTSVKKVADLNAEIASASGEQANGITQISKAMSSLDSSTQQNASASEEVAASSEELSSQASQLQVLVEELSRIVAGKSEMSSASARPQAVASFAPPRARVASVREPAVAAATSTAPARKAPQPGKTELKAIEGGKSKRKSANEAEKLIPFDSDPSDSPSKVGTTDGF